MTDEINDGGPAFPAQPRCVTSGGMRVDTHWPGMSLRDHFAGLAMQGLIANDNQLSLCKEDALDLGKSVMDEVSYDAYRYADAMITTRKEK